jgi:hypothetical protein
METDVEHHEARGAGAAAAEDIRVERVTKRFADTVAVDDLILVYRRRRGRRENEAIALPVAEAPAAG